jgi:pimeloyl-ACP methyl ester carboxylesterase
MNFRLLLFLFFACNSIFAQRKLSNPVIFVHGWTGSYETWSDFTNYLENQASLTIERSYLNYNLDCDYNPSTSNLYNDFCDNTGSLGNKDIYIINFRSGSSMSNQAGIVKQGYALKFAIQKVLNATGADNVILLGHSMGGLAIREYLQNSSNWQSDGQHHVSKLATIGTPHYGSNISGGVLSIFIGKDESSESVRDLRESYFYSNCTRGGQAIQCPGVYLWGGQETRTWMKTNALGGSSFYNIDVNCNGRTGDNIIGLNQKSIYTNLDFACVIGGPNNTDGIVTTFSQNLNNVYSNLGAELYYFDCNGDIVCHTNEPKKAFIQMLQAIDEPKKYPTSLKFGNAYKGFFTSQANGSSLDIDNYTFNVPQRGVVSFSASNVASSNGKITITDQSGNILSNESIENGSTKSFQISSAGNYNISISGNSLGSWATYGISLGFCGMPSIPSISASSSVNFCEGESVTLSTISGYDNYQWYRDGVQVSNSSSKLAVNQSGIFTVQASKCGVLSNSTNNITTLAKPIPIKPSIIIDEQPDQFLLTSSTSENNQWFLNGNLINGATNQTYIPQDLGVYTVKVIKEGCSNISDISTVKIDKPVLNVLGSNTLCEGDSSKIVAPIGFGSYIFSDGTKETEQTKNELIVKKDGKYSVSTKRGKFTSAISDAITIKVNPKPVKPVLTLENFGLKSSSPMNNQWFLNGTAIKDSTGQFLRSFGSGAYSVQVIENGCFSESDIFVITAIEPNANSFPIKLYPNPNEGTFWVELPQALKTWQIDIFDIQGKLIFSKLHKDSFIDKEKIELKTVSGSYIMRVTTAKATQSVKFIIE